MNKISSSRIKMRGHYTLEIRRFGRLVRVYDFDNMLMNYLLDSFNGATGPARPPSYCVVGASDAPPTPLDTHLGAFVASTSNLTFGTQTNSGSPNYITSQSYIYTFAQGAIVGDIKEIGSAEGPFNTSLILSRALITDNQGNPITINMLASDQLTVTYTVLEQIPVIGSAGSVNLQGVDYPYTSYYNDLDRTPGIGIWALNRRFNYGTGTGTFIFGANCPIPNLATIQTQSFQEMANAGGSVVSDSGTAITDAYTGGSFTQTGSLSWQAADANVTGGIKMIGHYFGTNNFSSLNRTVLYIFTTPIPKTNTQQLILNFSVSWGGA